MITVIYPCDRNNVWMTCDWACHLKRPGYKAQYAGTDYAGPEQPLWVSQYNGKVLQSMWSNLGYGNTTFVEHYDQAGNGVLRIRNAHQKDLAVSVGDIVQPGDLLGTMDSTGNSTGTHTHWEVWIKTHGSWQNIDPLNLSNGVKIVANKESLETLDGSEPIPQPKFKIPNVAFVPCKNMLYDPINLRTLPHTSAGARIIGRVEPASIWEYCGSKTDTVGNVWFALRKGDKIGWAAAYYNGAAWIVPQE